MKKFKDISGTDGMYKVNKIGEIFSTRSGKILKTTIGSPWTAYRQTMIINSSGKRITARIHRIVAQTFIPNPLNKPCVNHKDGNRLNNNVNNLEWTTIEENVEHARINHLLGGRQLVKTMCPKGHPYSGNNLYQYKRNRLCRTCLKTKYLQRSSFIKSLRMSFSKSPLVTECTKTN